MIDYLLSWEFFGALLVAGIWWAVRGRRKVRSADGAAPASSARPGLLGALRGGSAPLSGRGGGL